MRLRHRHRHMVSHSISCPFGQVATSLIGYDARGVRHGGDFATGEIRSFLVKQTGDIPGAEKGFRLAAGGRPDQWSLI